ncbi:P-loop containing nucleoside triphosphate hydrolase protein [Mycena albidolilacea]|uniref:P-loop containing nucleoside triphosphate hydrolase protein n=1 Tax=Mycena albidolilacea TaxID=1033008 RepID=A0AAD6Z828_9AGAR|nr:P-loop containing nucleoside triphosphate hydrolase protein [Mycena albidolilacea]
MVSPTWHNVLKFIITGDAATGKSSLLVHLTDQRFLANPDPTFAQLALAFTARRRIGPKLITLSGPEATVVKLQCWDTAGTESFRSITRSYYRGAAGCLLVYDVTSRISFDSMRTWLAGVRAHADAHASCVPVGNRVDLVGGGGVKRGLCSRRGKRSRSDRKRVESVWVWGAVERAARAVLPVAWRWFRCRSGRTREAAGQLHSERACAWASHATPWERGARARLGGQGTSPASVFPDASAMDIHCGGRLSFILRSASYDLCLRRSVFAGPGPGPDLSRLLHVKCRTVQSLGIWA